MTEHPVLPAEESVLTTVDEENLCKKSGKIKKKHYKRELKRLQEELVRLQMGSKSRDSGSSCFSTVETRPAKAERSTESPAGQALG